METDKNKIAIRNAAVGAFAFGVIQFLNALVAVQVETVSNLDIFYTCLLVFCAFCGLLIMMHSISASIIFFTCFLAINLIAHVDLMTFKGIGGTIILTYFLWNGIKGIHNDRKAKKDIDPKYKIIPIHSIVLIGSVVILLLLFVVGFFLDKFGFLT